MTLYGATVLLVVFGLLMAALDILLLAMTPALLAILARRSPGQGTDAIVLFRFLPVGLAALLATAVFLPAWLRHEPSNTGEATSAGLLALALLAVLPMAQGFHRAARMFLKTRDRLLFWRRRGRNTSMFQAPFDVVEVTSEDLALCVGGYWKPTIYASSQVRKSLEPEEFSAALAHEVSHANTRDPLRLLLMASCPDFLQLFRLDGAWRRGFATACELAADEGASGGNRHVALDLASALLKVARLRTFRPLSAEAMIDMAVSSAFSSRADLEARIHALANPQAGVLLGAGLQPWMLAAAAVVLCGAGVMASEQVHAAAEELGRLLAAR